MAARPKLEEATPVLPSRPMPPAESDPSSHIYTVGHSTRELEKARGRRTAFMCSEIRWERCHRRLIPDWLTVRGWIVIHLVDAERAEEHHLPELARVVDDGILYNGGQMELPKG